MISIELGKKVLESANSLMAIAPKEVRKAAYSAIKRTTSRMNTRASRHIRQNYTVSASALKGRIKADLPKGNFLSGSIVATGRPTNISQFRITPNPVSVLKRSNGRKRKRRNPFLVQLKKSGVKKPVQRLFAQEHKNKKGDTKISVLQRTTKYSYPLKLQYGPSVPQMLGSEKVLESFAPEAEKFLNERFLHEIKFRLGGIK